MEVTGKIIVAMPEVGGTSAKGNAWKKREYVLETLETYPKKVFFNFFGDRVDQFPLQVGQVVKISFDIDSREYNGRWYVDVRAWKAEAPDATPQAAPAAPAVSYGVAPQMPGGYATPGAPVPPPAVDLAPTPTDDLPF
ncbi:DUF3127 domain-containing protein [uncultured Duncaniella sp.]|jgi:hypothetical protein|uniref:DUF3127 domain-containing protein n=1 Tax=uncultured Duncaniella sp. TaxID=2768039 RepID=UPI002675D112|nr:DUF3127 domain-containing protein [uncultured Duncaniella sp.]MCI9173147.1 DUF3127 domain-containing protein [Muribaculaceae bacterium]